MTVRLGLFTLLCSRASAEFCGQLLWCLGCFRVFVLGKVWADVIVGWLCLAGRPSGLGFHKGSVEAGWLPMGSREVEDGV